MQFLKGDILHVYNRGNNKQQIFFNEDNYTFFTAKVGKYVANTSDILAYCLMPNHFHFLLHVNEMSCTPKKIGSLMSTELQNGFRMLQSSYASAINKQLNRTGSLFQQNTKYKLLDDDNYVETCFHYVHQNPLHAGLVNKLENWRHSSFREYMTGEEKLCKQRVLFQLLDIDPAHFYERSYMVLGEEGVGKIF